MKMIILLVASNFEHFEIWRYLLRVQTSNIHGSSMAESIFTI